MTPKNVWCVIINSTKSMQNFGVMGIRGIYYNCLFNFTHPPTLSALLLILSSSRLIVVDFPVLVPVPFLSLALLTGMAFHFLSNRNPLWALNQTA